MAKLIHYYSKASEVRKLLIRAFSLLSPGYLSNIREARQVLSSACDLLDSDFSCDI